MSSGITIDLFTDSESDDGFKGQSVDLYTSGAGEMTDANGDFSAMDDQSVGSFSGGSGGGGGVDNNNASKKKPRKEICNQRIKSLITPRRFLCFNRGEFVVFDAAGIEAKFGRIRSRSSTDGSLEITLYVLESYFDEKLQIRVLTQLTGQHSVVTIQESNVVKNVLCYFPDEFCVGSIGAPSNKIPIIKGVDDDVYVVYDDSILLPEYMSLRTIRTKDALDSFIKSAFSPVAADDSPLNLFLGRCGLSFEIQKEMRQCCKSKETCSGKISASSSFMLYMLSMLISRDGIVSTVKYRSNSKMTILNTSSLAEDVRFKHEGFRVKIEPDKIRDIFGDDSTRAIKPRSRGQGISTNELSYTRITGVMNFDFYFAAQFIQFSFHVRYRSDDSGFNMIERYTKWLSNLPSFMAGNVYELEGQYFELLRFENATHGLFVNLSLVSVAILSDIRVAVGLKKEVWTSFSAFLMLRRKEELAQCIEAKPIAGLNLECPVLFNIAERNSNDEKVRYWLKFLTNKNNLGANLLSAIDNEMAAYPSFAKVETLNNVLRILKIENASPTLSFGEAIFNEFVVHCSPLMSSARKRKMSYRFST